MNSPGISCIHLAITEAWLKNAEAIGEGLTSVKPAGKSWKGDSN